MRDSAYLAIYPHYLTFSRRPQSIYQTSFKQVGAMPANLKFRHFPIKFPQHAPRGLPSCNAPKNSPQSRPWCSRQSNKLAPWRHFYFRLVQTTLPGSMPDYAYAQSTIRADHLLATLPNAVSENHRPRAIIDVWWQAGVTPALRLARQMLGSCAEHPHATCRIAREAKRCRATPA